MRDGDTSNRLVVLGACAAVALAVAVACGAFGAHALKASLPPERLGPDMAIWEKAVLYNFVHALGALVLTGGAYRELSATTRARIATLLLAATVIFSGSLYLLVLTNQRWLGMITPCGGLGFIVAWVWLTAAFLRASRRKG
jgi:uncharacterized membrane protein YgdD (TMEM256/DUF423 family)